VLRSVHLLPSNRRISGRDDQSSRPPRPVAADFFNDGSSAVDPVTTKSDTGPWRRKLSHELDRDPHSDIGSVSMNQSESVAANVEQRIQPLGTSSCPRSIIRLAHQGKVGAYRSAVRYWVYPTTTGPGMINGQLRTTRSTTTYREATMSALDDVMSRIKGALDGMQTPEKGTCLCPEVQSPKGASI
jgi:serine/arginine repetitive matrix protein 2